MRVFMTGATGYIGSAVCRTLLAGGHEVTVLARNPEKATALKQAGARMIQGGLDSLDDLRDQVVRNEVFIHIAQSGSEMVDLDEKAIHVFTSNHD
ncbi:MAG: NAD(P)H-binding protein, partial [Thermoanaerobaculia bacterium]